MCDPESNGRDAAAPSGLKMMEQTFGGSLALTAILIGVFTLAAAGLEGVARGYALPYGFLMSAVGVLVIGSAAAGFFAYRDVARASKMTPYQTRVVRAFTAVLLLAAFVPIGFALTLFPN